MKAKIAEIEFNPAELIALSAKPHTQGMGFFLFHHLFRISAT